MKIIHNAKDMAKRSLSLWVNRAAFLSLLMPEVLFYFFEIDTNPMIWWVLGLVLYVCVEVSRYIDQGMARSPAIVGVLALLSALGLPDPGTAMSKVQPVAPEVVIGGLPSEAEFLDVATPLVGKWEGKRNTAYLDTIASPPVWTVCYGETRGVKRGDSYTDAQCASMLGKALLTYRDGLHTHFSAETKAKRLTPERDAAYVDLAYNVGIRRSGGSTAVKRLNVGNIAGGCAALGWWNRAGKKVVRGLVNRRADDTRLCMIGLPA